MSSWFAGAAKDWNTSLQDTLNRAASSVQKIADQAELQQLHVLCSRPFQKRMNRTGDVAAWEGWEGAWMAEGVDG